MGNISCPRCNYSKDANNNTSDYYIKYICPKCFSESLIFNENYKGPRKIKLSKKLKLIELDEIADKIFHWLLSIPLMIIWFFVNYGAYLIFCVFRETKTFELGLLLIGLGIYSIVYLIGIIVWIFREF